MRRIAVAVMAAACGSPAAAPPPRAPLVAAPLPRTTGAPTLAIADGAIVATGLPAIAAAGEVIELAYGAPALTLEVRGADDHVLHALQVTAAAGVEAGNQQLATDHGVHDLRAMRPLDVEAAHGGEDQHWATGDNLDVEWREDHVRVFRHNVTQPLADRDGTHWLAPQGSAACVGANAAFLRAVYHAVGTPPGGGNTVVVAIGYRGTASCPAPADQLHVISWVAAR